MHLIYNTSCTARHQNHEPKETESIFKIRHRLLHFGLPAQILLFSRHAIISKRIRMKTKTITPGITFNLSPVQDCNTSEVGYKYRIAICTTACHSTALAAPWMCYDVPPLKINLRGYFLQVVAGSVGWGKLVLDILNLQNCGVAHIRTCLVAG